MDSSMQPIRRFPLPVAASREPGLGFDPALFAKSMRRMALRHSVSTIFWSLALIALIAWIGMIAWAAGPAVTLGVAALTYTQTLGWMLSLRIVAWGFGLWRKVK